MLEISAGSCSEQLRTMTTAITTTATTKIPATLLLQSILTSIKVFPCSCSLVPTTIIPIMISTKSLFLISRGVTAAAAKTSLGSLSTLTTTTQSRFRFYSSSKPVAVSGMTGKAGDGVPSMETAKAMPRSFSEMDNEVLMTIAATGAHDACVEVLKRHIMAIDEVPYEEACVQFEKLAKKNREGMWLDALPYQIGIGVATTAAFVSLPMVFDLHTTLWFNKDFVTTDVPEPADLETMLEVGSWSWNWMEPPLGTFSFALLCLQFSRAQLQNLGVKPYTSWLRERRSRMVSEAFPQYDPGLIHIFSETDPMFKIS